MKKIIEIARLELGYTETPANTNLTKFGEWFGLNAVPWCGIFVSWCYAKAGYPLGVIGYMKGFAGCQYAVAHFRQTGEITTEPQPGDIVFFDWNNDGRHDHTGIFVKGVDSDTFKTIEGNTSLGNDSNGGEVMGRIRKYKQAIFVHPKILDVA